MAKIRLSFPPLHHCKKQTPCFNFVSTFDYTRLSWLKKVHSYLYEPCIRMCLDERLEFFIHLNYLPFSYLNSVSVFTESLFVNHIHHLQECLRLSHRSSCQIY